MENVPFLVFLLVFIVALIIPLPRQEESTDPMDLSKDDDEYSKNS